MPLDNLIDILSTSKTALFLGAGVSKQSGIPLVWEIVQELLSSLKITGDDADEFNSKPIPFEAIIQAVTDGSSAAYLFSLFSGSGPQRNHLLFSRLAFGGNYGAPLILTTNFDTLIEQASNHYGNSIEVIFDDTVLDFNTFDSGKPRLIKLHGCLTRPEAMGATIRAVANQRGVESRKKLLKYCLDAKNIEHVIVMGYSFSDKFDINPALLSLTPSTKFWLINHDPSNSLTTSQLSTLSHSHPLHNKLGVIINVDTDVVIEHIWRKTQTDPPPPIVSCTSTLKYAVESWSNQIERLHGQAGILIRAATLLKINNCYVSSSKYAEAALGTPNIDSKPELAAWAHQIIGDNNRDLYHAPSKAKYHIREALKLAHRANRIDLKSKAINSLGILLEDQAKELDKNSEISEPRPSRNTAIKYYTIASAWAESINDQEQIAKCCGNIGIAYKNINNTHYRRLAFKHLRKALLLSIDLGDLKSTARYYGMMASCLSLMGKKKCGILLWEQALKISGDLGDLLHVAIWTANLGEDLIPLDAIRAEILIKNAKDIFYNLGINPVVSG